MIRLTLIYAYTFCLKGCNWSALFVCTVYYGPIVLTNRSFQPDAPNLNSDLSTIMQKTVKSIAYTTINFSTKIQSNLIRTVFEMTWIAFQFFTVVSGHFDKTVSINYYLQFTVVDSVLLNGLKAINEWTFCVCFTDLILSMKFCCVFSICIVNWMFFFISSLNIQLNAHLKSTNPLVLLIDLPLIWLKWKSF